MYYKAGYLVTHWLEIFLLSAGTQEILILKKAGVTLAESFHQKEILIHRKHTTGPIATSALLFQSLRYTDACTHTNKHHPSPTAAQTLTAEMGLSYKILV